MKVIAVKLLEECWNRHHDAESTLKAWLAEAREAQWRTPQDIRDRYRSVDFLPGNRAVFNVRGNRYRLVVAVNYANRIIVIRFAGTHAEYNKIDAEII